MIIFNYSENHHHYRSSAISTSTIHYHCSIMNYSTKSPLPMNLHSPQNYQKNTMIHSIMNSLNFEMTHALRYPILMKRATIALCEIGNKLSFLFQLYQLRRSFITICAVLSHCRSLRYLWAFSYRPLSKHRRRRLIFGNIFCFKEIK